MNNKFFFLSDAYGHPHPASLTSELEERAPASNNAGNHVPRGQTLRGTTFGYLCKSVKKTSLLCHTGHLSKTRGQQTGTFNSISRLQNPPL